MTEERFRTEGEHREPCGCVYVPIDADLAAHIGPGWILATPCREHRP